MSADGVASGGGPSDETAVGGEPGGPRVGWWGAWRARRRAARQHRRMRGVVRRIDPWSVFRVSLVFYVAMYGIVLVAGVLLWSAATATGFRGNVENFIAGLTESGEFRFVADELFRASVVIGALLAVMGTGANVLFAVLYNLISDVVGGMVVVVEERPSRKALRSADSAPPPSDATAESPDVRPAPPERPSVPAAAAAAAASVMPGALGAPTAAAPAAAGPAAIVGDFGLGSLGPGPGASASPTDGRTE